MDHCFTITNNFLLQY